MGCNCGNPRPPFRPTDPNCPPPPRPEDRDWDKARWHERWEHDDCNVPPRPVPHRKFNYFGQYTDLEKQIIAEQLGFSEGNVTVVNYPDGEDLTQRISSNQKVLKFKDKDYDPQNCSGYGRVYLRKNIEGTTCGRVSSAPRNILRQEMFYDENGNPRDHTIFIIQYDYDLDDAYIKLPEDSILKFEGGSLSNGTLMLNNTYLYPMPFITNLYLHNIQTANDPGEGQLTYYDDKLELQISKGEAKELKFAE